MGELIETLERITAPTYVASGLDDTARVAAAVEVRTEKNKCVLRRLTASAGTVREAD